jgi:hypothetical protein
MELLTGNSSSELVQQAEKKRRESNCRPSAFQEFYHLVSTYLKKAPTAQLTRIDAADRLFSVL